MGRIGLESNGFQDPSSYAASTQALSAPLVCVCVDQGNPGLCIINIAVHHV